MGAPEYDDPMNLAFLYGEVTKDFLLNIPFTKRGETILDIGCGTGFAFEVLKDRFDRLNLSGIGIDPAKGMLDLARGKYANAQKFKFLFGSFENIPLPDRSVERIISTLALHWVKDFGIAVKEMRRVLTNNGRLRPHAALKWAKMAVSTILRNSGKNSTTFSIEKKLLSPMLPCLIARLILSR